MSKSAWNARFRSAPVFITALEIVGFAVATENPTVEFTHIPPYGSSNDLTGRVANVDHTAYGVAVYIYVDGWWTKPTFAQPLSSIHTDGTWTCDITTGGSDAYATQLAAYLVPTNYSPPQAWGLSQLPDELASNAVASVRVVRPYTRRFWFSGYEWSVKDSRSEHTGPGDNYFSESASNVWTDAQGRLHLKICQREGIWSCAEVVSVRSFGFGTYRTFTSAPSDGIDTNAVLGLFTWNDDAPYSHREIDIEVSRWGNASDTNTAQFVVQPWDTSGHLTRYRVSPAVTNATYSFTWLSNRIDFASHAGFFAPAPATNTAVAQWSFADEGVPQPGGENYRISLWLYNTAGTTDGLEEEVVIDRFAFIPSPMPRPAWTNLTLETNGSLALAASVEPQITYRVETSTNLFDWDIRETFTQTNTTLRVTDTATSPSRFYRLTLPEQ